MSERVTYLLTTQVNALNTWGGELRHIFNGLVQPYGAYIVGSSLTKSDWRDVDVRHIVPDRDYDALVAVIDIGYFNHVMSVWGQQVTGLPIDYQVQRASDPENDGPKHPIDMFDGYVNGQHRIPR